jgi:hypothetical protein
MSWEFLIKRRFEVVTAAITLSLVFLLVVWAAMVLLRAINQVTFHFSLPIDILPWATPVAIILLLVGPLYWKVAGLLKPPQGGLQRLADHRFELVMGSAAYLFCYTMVVWGTMVLLRGWDPVDFHYNFVVDWLPVILPPWLTWMVAVPFLYKTLAAIAGGYDAHPRAIKDWSPVIITGFVGAIFLGAGGLVLNEGVYAGTQGLATSIQQDMVYFGMLVFTVGGIAWAIMLGQLLWGWRRQPTPAGRPSPLDRFTMERPRIVAQSFVLINVLFGMVGLLMTAVQFVDAQDFHFYMAKDIWVFGIPIFFGWFILTVGAHVVPRRLAARDPARWGPGRGLALGPTGPAAEQASWGYQGRDLAGSGPVT